MNAHTILESFLSSSVRVKAAVLAAIALVALGVPLAAYYKGRSAALGAAEDRYIRERDRNLARIADLEDEVKFRDDNEKQLAAENALLRKRNEAAAEILRRNDTAIAGDAAKFLDLQEKRDGKIRSIDLDTDFDAQLCGLCRDLVRSGFPELSVCGRCKDAPEGRR